jgi:hypothetical protein
VVSEPGGKNLFMIKPISPHEFDEKECLNTVSAYGTG